MDNLYRPASLRLDRRSWTDAELQERVIATQQMRPDNQQLSDHDLSRT